mmetsp:Transcript_66624/g.77318  ORF Transcript_66624/g.77318 Transcript_66624/m.77318 type:complete len:235 (+) Transcript_66624:44-748(+)
MFTQATHTTLVPASFHGNQSMQLLGMLGNNSLRFIPTINTTQNFQVQNPMQGVINSLLINSLYQQQMMNALSLQQRIKLASANSAFQRCVNSQPVEAINVATIQKENVIPEPKIKVEAEEEHETDESDKVNETDEDGSIRDDRLAESSEEKVSSSLRKISKSKKIKKKRNTCGHHDKKHYAKGMCNGCYHKYGRISKPTLCDHELLYAKGLCQKCYVVEYNQKKIMKTQTTTAL